jgi:serine/threonine protein kinase
MGAQELHTAVSRLLQIDEGQHYEIDDKSCLPFQHIENLGSGRSGIVDKIVHTQTNSVYARKTFEVRPGEWSRVRDDFRREINITRRLARHRHIVRLIATYSTPNGPAVILEPAADGGTLSAFLARFVMIENKAAKAPLWTTLYRAYGCLANGLTFMHQHQIRHRDIKPENILLHCGSVLFTDFGISRDYSDQTRATTEGRPDFYTPRYCAPEVRWWERRTWKSDVFSLGCVFLVMYTAAWPDENIGAITPRSHFHEHLDELEKIMDGFTHDAEVVECMKGMMRYEEGHRPSAADTVRILKNAGHRYFCEPCRGNLRMWVTPVLQAPD